MWNVKFGRGALFPGRLREHHELGLQPNHYRPYEHADPAQRGRRERIEELREHGSRELASFKLPEVVVIINEIPRNATDKIDRRKLLEIIMNRDKN